jgi:hypothetical protein
MAVWNRGHDNPAHVPRKSQFRVGLGNIPSEEHERADEEENYVYAIW